ncbi:MAG: prenyltransferase/squalene oxidase repeat-containing protein [Promethearchaeota archaeon]
MKHKYRNLILTIFLLLITINAIPTVLGKTRYSYLITFIRNNEIEGEGFTNAINDEISLEATMYALNILDSYGINPLEVETLNGNLENRIEDMFNNDEVSLYDLCFLLKSLNSTEYTIDSDLSDRIYDYVNDAEQLTGGFSFSNTSEVANLASTYFAIQIHFAIGRPIVNLTLHKNWVLSCNNSDGGYGGNQTLSSTLINTFFVALILDEIGDISELVSSIDTLNYLKSFYVNDSADFNSFGGYIPEDLAQYALLSSTYFCVKIISLIDPGELNTNPTINWILARQNFKDGGFAENTEGYQQKISSVIATYFAFETIKILNPSLSSLSSEIWMVEFNYIILGVILGSIGLLIAVAIFLWRRRRI